MDLFDTILLHDVVGLVGLVSILAAYFLLQTNRLTSDSYPYLILNLAGASMVLISLLFEFNLPAFLLEAAWVLISLYGVASRFSRKTEGPVG